MARAQQSGEMRHIGVLLMVAESDPEAQSRIKSFQQGLRQLGWSTGFWASSGCEAGHKFAGQLITIKLEEVMGNNHAF